MTTPEQNLENQLIRLAQHEASKPEGQQGKGWLGWLEKQSEGKSKTSYLAATFDVIFRQMQ